MNGLQSYITNGVIQGLAGGLDNGFHDGVSGGERKSPVVHGGLNVNLDASYPINKTQQLAWIDSVQGFNATRSNLSVFLSSNGGNYFLATAGGANFIATTQTVTNQIPLGNSPRTVQGWFKVDSYSGDGLGRIIAWGTDTGVGQLFAISLTAAGNIWLFGSSGYNYTSTIVVPLNKWVNISCIFDGTTLYFALNGVLDLGIARTYNTQVSALSIFGRGLTGSVGEVLIYNRALTKDELMFNYTSDINKYN
jgi:hypothetical protein